MRLILFVINNLGLNKSTLEMEMQFYHLEEPLPDNEDFMELVKIK